MYNYLAVFIAIVCVNVYGWNDSTKTVIQQFREVSRKSYPNYLGYDFGYSSGFGVSYRRCFNDNYSMQLTIWPYFSKSQQGAGEDQYISAGISGYRNIIRANYARIYGYIGSRYEYDRKWAKYDYYSESRHDTIAVDYDITRHQITAAAGTGIDITLWRIVISIQCCIGPFWEFRNSRYDGFVFTIFPEAGVYIGF
jgi:hypothetical protein